jgi:hypothetical protein
MGAGTGGPAKPRTAADAVRSMQIRRDPMILAQNAERKKSKEERAAALVDFLEEIALDHAKAVAAAEGPAGILALRLAAADKALDRIVGKAMQPTVNLNMNATELTREQRRAEIERLLAKRAASEQPMIEAKAEPDGE